MYLLDINVLLAFHYAAHVHHTRAEQWIQRVRSLTPEPFATCSIVELGFIRIASGGSGLAANLTDARADLRHAKADLMLRFLPDDLDGDRLPDWVTRSKQTTDGHLLELALRNRVELATLDGKIPGALEIPEHPESADWPSMVRESSPPVYGAAA